MGKIANIIKDGMANIMLEELAEVGRDVQSLNDTDEIFLAYFNTCLLFPQPQTYYVHIHNDIVCPPENKEGYELLLKKMRYGEKFSAHLSRTTKQTENHDFMLYEWGIYHFHLGTIKDNDGYIQRTQKLLYAYIDNNHIYFLGIFDHGKWNDQDLIEIIHEYYPWSIKGWKIDGRPEMAYSDEDRKNMRKAHVNTFVTMADGTTYMGPGMGITAAGTSSRVRMWANDKHHESVYLEKELFAKMPNAEDFEWRMERNGNDIFLVNNEGGKYKLYEWVPLRTRVEQNRL